MEAKLGTGPMLGTKIKSLRRREGISQVALAERLQVSPSYLNLIENNNRPLTAPMLIRIAELFKVDLQSFASTDETRTLSDLMEIFGDPLFEPMGLTNADVRELAIGQPNVARAVVALYRTLQNTRESAQSMAGRLSGDADVAHLEHFQLPSEEVSELIQRRMNYFPVLEEAAEALWRDGHLDTDDIFRSLAAWLQKKHGIEVKVTRAASDPGAVRRYDPERKLLTLSDQLPPRTRNFQLVHQVALLTQNDAFDRVLRDEGLRLPDSLALARVALANYFAAAVLMPYQPFLEAARAERYDIELLGHRFRCSFEQIAHRMTTLRRPHAEGVPFHFLRIDIAGNISKRFTASGIQFARFAGACPRWNIHTAFLTPGRINIQVSRMPDGVTYFCVARTVRRDSGGFHAQHTVQAIGLGCRVELAKELVYSDGVELSNPNSVVPVGVTCRLCERMDCEQRVFPPLAHPLKVDENVRGVSFYAPARVTERGQS
jgi:predicted transcriptional regulator/plasmid maintenance system antidote protein VapI